VLSISSLSRVGLDALKQTLLETIEAIPRETVAIELVEDLQATNNDDSHMEIEVVDPAEGVYRLHCRKADRWLSITDITEFQSLSRFWHVLKSMGVFNALEAHGAKPGDTIIIGTEMFDYTGQSDTLDEHEFDRFQQGFALDDATSKHHGYKGFDEALEGQAANDEEEEGQLLELSLDDWEELLTHDDSDLEMEPHPRS
jgi:Obg family GTPase CgtA-like protein